MVNDKYPTPLLVLAGVAFGFVFGLGVGAQMSPRPMTAQEMAGAIADCEAHGLRAGAVMRYGYQTVGINCEPKQVP